MPVEASPAGFAMRQHDIRIFAGSRTIEERLAAEADRVGGSRAFVVASPSGVASGLVARIEAALGPHCAGGYYGVDRDSSFDRVREAWESARECRADLVIAAGGGSVLVAGRAVAVFLGESGDPFELMTRYPPGGAPRSPRLTAPKPPVINIPVTPTTAMDRAGVGLQNPSLDHRMEYFDPKVRPQAIFWDFQALDATPAKLFADTGFSVLIRALGDLAEPTESPLDAADRRSALHYSMKGVAEYRAGALGLSGRLLLCSAAFIQTRIEDSRGRLRPASPYAGDYGISTALHLAVPRVSQGEAVTSSYEAAVRLAPPPDPDQTRRLAAELGVAGKSDAALHEACIRVVVDRCAEAGMPTRLRDLGVDRRALEGIAALTVRNFNHDPSGRRAEERQAEALRILQLAW